MLRSQFYVSLVIASFALTALFEASDIQAGPASGAQSSRFRGSGSYSYSAPATAVTPANTGEPLLYSYYAPPTRSAAASEEESESGQDAAARIDLTVPAGAAVWFDGKMTQQTGSRPDLRHAAAATGQDVYLRPARCGWTAAGGIVVDVTRPIQVRAGRQTIVGFKQ